SSPYRERRQARSRSAPSAPGRRLTRSRLAPDRSSSGSSRRSATAAWRSHYHAIVSKPPLRDAFDARESKRRSGRRLSGTMADRYHFITGFVSFGRDAGWKPRMVAGAGIEPGWRVLDLACGTGDLAFESARRGARVVGLDITPRMVE